MPVALGRLDFLDLPLLLLLIGRHLNTSALTRYHLWLIIEKRELTFPVLEFMNPRMTLHIIVADDCDTVEGA